MKHDHLRFNRFEHGKPVAVSKTAFSELRRRYQAPGNVRPTRLPGIYALTDTLPSSAEGVKGVRPHARIPAHCMDVCVTRRQPSSKLQRVRLICARNTTYTIDTIAGIDDICTTDTRWRRQPWPTNNEMHRISLSFRRGKSREPVPSEPLGACPDPERSEGEWGDEGRNPFENWNRVRIPNPFAKGISRRLSCLRQHGSLEITIEAQLRLYCWCPSFYLWDLTNRLKTIDYSPKCSCKKAIVRSHASFAACALYASGRSVSMNQWPVPG